MAAARLLFVIVIFAHLGEYNTHLVPQKPTDHRYRARRKTIPWFISIPIPTLGPFSTSCCPKALVIQKRQGGFFAVNFKNIQLANVQFKEKYSVG